MEIANISNAELAKSLKGNGIISIKLQGYTIEDVWGIGSKAWFEYHCWESPQSSDAEIWYRSHQQVVIIGVANCDPIAFTTFEERADSGCQLLYRVRFNDGLEWDIFEDELLTNPSQFERPDPRIE
jgi:hypothetical protein